jgi:hypothetical protein
VHVGGMIQHPVFVERLELRELGTDLVRPFVVVMGLGSRRHTLKPKLGWKVGQKLIRSGIGQLDQATSLMHTD